jgi:hypothetical protein
MILSQSRRPFQALRRSPSEITLHDLRKPVETR